TQYRSVIFYNDAEQEKTARAVMDEIAKAGIWEGKIVTEIRPLEKFWPAESEHDDYFTRHPETGYCRAVVAPKVRKFREHFSNLMKAA
ncbi:MAG: peptide-methionine (S)-S-oxide reductase, partial [Acetobacteraceae bacterium]